VGSTPVFRAIWPPFGKEEWPGENLGVICQLIENWTDIARSVYFSEIDEKERSFESS
jgi:hypothetical protein